ncbi:integrase core domain-containing protein [Sphaerisporangium aureirubrum]|uniref:Integrase core domain-containing protein n=1 Tax=Sphaerisporangium aureirubrum TaxID=1544736 RepID=A0ABW1NEW1_9ACTN
MPLSFQRVAQESSNPPPLNSGHTTGLLGSMGTVGDCYDNAMMESFWGTMQLELLDTRTWKTREELANTVFEWIECWYNPYRRHSGIGMHSPVTFEGLHLPSDTNEWPHLRCPCYEGNLTPESGATPGRSGWHHRHELRGTAAQRQHWLEHIGTSNSFPSPKSGCCRTAAPWAG